MKTILKEKLLILIPETSEEVEQLGIWKSTRGNHVFRAVATNGSGLSLHQLGDYEVACQVPVAISSRSADDVALISNFAPTPFELDGAIFGSVEGFWQALKFTDDQERARVGLLDGLAARNAGKAREYGSHVSYQGGLIAVGTWDHWQLMEKACRAKFQQNESARTALLSTWPRPLIHRVRRDSRTIPGVIMADIWMRLRAWLHSDAAETHADSTFL